MLTHYDSDFHNVSWTLSSNSIKLSNCAWKGCVDDLLCTVASNGEQALRTGWFCLALFSYVLCKFAKREKAQYVLNPYTRVGGMVGAIFRYNDSQSRGIEPSSFVLEMVVELSSTIYHNTEEFFCRKNNKTAFQL